MPGRGTGLRRPRGKAHRLPREYKRVLIGMLLEEADYADIAIAIAEAGCPAELIPSEKSIGTYAEGEQFQRLRGEWLRSNIRSEERAALASALSEGGIEGAADLVTFEALDKMYLALRDPDSGANPTALARLAVAVKKSAADEERAKLKAEIAALKARLEADEEKPKAVMDRKAVVRELDRLMGVEA